MMQNRRQFCHTIGITSAAAAIGNVGYSYCRQIPKIPFGNTGLHVSRLGFSTSQLHTAHSKQQADHLVRYMLDSGVTYMDTSPYYGMGYAEQLLGQIVSPQREQVIIASKTRSVDSASVMQDMEESLKRLKTDYVDVLLLDNPHPKHQTNHHFKEGALTAALAAKKQGKCRFVGITGQSHPLWTMSYLKQHSYDVVQVPLNAVDPHYLSFEDNVLTKLDRTQTAIVGCKTYAMGKLRDNAWITQTEALEYALSLPVTVTLVSCSTKLQAREDIRAFHQIETITDERKEQILSRTKPLSTRDVEWYKAIV